MCKVNREEQWKIAEEQRKAVTYCILILLMLECACNVFS